MPKLREFLFGRKPKVQQATTQTPQQQQYQQQLLQQASQGMPAGIQYLMNILSDDPAAYEQFAAPIRRDFEQQTVPTIAERFASMGTGEGAMPGGSGLNLALAQAGRELDQNLAQMRMGLKSQALQQLQSLGGMGMQPSFQNVYDQGDPGALMGLLQGLAQGAGKAATSAAGAAFL